MSSFKFRSPHSQSRHHYAFDDAQRLVTHSSGYNAALSGQVRSTRAGAAYAHTHNDNRWYQPAEAVGTSSSLPPLLNAVVDPNHIGTGSTTIELAPSVKYMHNHDPFHKPIVRGGRRERTGNPYTDNLIGVEPNPGPGLPKKKGSSKQAIGGRRRLTQASDNRYSAPIATGSHYRGNRRTGMVSTGTKMMLGSPAHIFKGRCAFQSCNTTGTGVINFFDGTAAASIVYMNPRICCQNSNYNTPQGKCPIGVIAQPFRKYSFRKLRISYEPTSTSTTMQGALALAYDPEVMSNISFSTTTVMNFANFEASAVGSVWAPLSLDLTKWLDRSKWFYGETPTDPGASYIASQAIQGSLILCQSTVMEGGATANGRYLGMFFMDFELALSELGPTEVFTNPVLSRIQDSSSSSKGEKDSPDTTCSKSDILHEEYLVVNGERKLIQQSTLK